MEAATIAELARSGGLVLYSVVVTLAAAALWKKYNEALDKLVEMGRHTAKEGREMQSKTLEQSAATQLTIQANTQAIQALEKTLERRQ